MSPPSAASVHLVPNFHPASCGWLANWSVERNHCANTYLCHLDRVATDPGYRFVISEVNNLIAILNFQPERFEELRQRVAEGRVEAVNAFFLEATMSLGGGEIYARMGVEGLRWQQHLLQTRPRFAWCIDICGTPDQMAQITAQLGLEALVFTRNNRRESDSNVFIGVSPDGTRVPVIAPTHYSDFGTKGLCQLYTTTESLNASQLAELRDYFLVRAQATPPGAPVLVLSGKGDYSTPPINPAQPAELVAEWSQHFPEMTLRVSTLSDFMDELRPVLENLPVLPVSTRYTWNAFWIQNPRVKARFRRSEHTLHAAEVAATLASLANPRAFPYPTETFYHAWLQLCLNADRNTLWGAAGGMVFEHETSWDAQDRFSWIAQHGTRITHEALAALAPSSPIPSLFNPLNWERCDPIDGCLQATLPACGIGTRPNPAPERKLSSVPAEIRTDHYAACIDTETGEITSLRALPSGREVLGGPANRLVAEKALRPEWYAAGDNLLLRPERPRLAASNEFPATLEASENDVALCLTVRNVFHGGGACVRVIRFNKHYPRIDFETTLQAVPDQTVVLTEFPLSSAPTEIRRGVPFGFSHGSWPEGRCGLEGILPAIRWSDYELPSGAAVSILDRGVPAREFTGKTAALLLLNTVSHYYGFPNPWLSGEGDHTFAYALAVRDVPWKDANVARLAWEFNQPPIVVASSPQAVTPPLRTSRNLIIEALRRVGDEVEIRAIECLGLPGEAEVDVGFEFTEASLTDFLGERRQWLGAGKPLRFPVRPQQIITLRLRTRTSVPEAGILTDWSPLVPEAKLAALRKHLPEAIGHPPRGD